jgi:hypothetical protein
MSKIFTPQVFSEISNLVAQGFSAAEIADKVGCKLASLRVKCSQQGIRLRQPKPGSESKPRERLTVRLFGDIALRLEQQAEKQGKSSTEFAAVLLEAIVRDNLYEAVIDQDVVGPGSAIASGSPFKNVPRPKAPPPRQPLTPRRLVNTTARLLRSRA